MHARYAELLPACIQYLADAGSLDAALQVRVSTILSRSEWTHIYVSMCFCVFVCFQLYGELADSQDVSHDESSLPFWVYKALIGHCRERDQIEHAFMLLDALAEAGHDPGVRACVHVYDPLLVHIYIKLIKACLPVLAARPPNLQRYGCTVCVTWPLHRSPCAN